MRFDLAHQHFSRRDALRLGTAGAAAIAAGGVLGAAPAAARSAPRADDHDGRRHRDDGPLTGGPYTDEMFDVEAVADGGEWPSLYGPDDERGTLNEVDAKKTAWALQILDPHKPVNTYQLGEAMFNGFPAFPSEPPRLHDMFLYVLGYDAGDEFADGGGIQSGTEPLGPNLVVGHEERFDQNFTLQIGTQVDGLAHVGIGTGDARGGRFYNDIYATDIVTPTGTTRLGNETMGPIVTRGVIIDIVGLKVAAGATDDFFEAPNGQPVLRDDYRITVDDIEHALRRQRTWRVKAGDVAMLHTGWTHLVTDDPERYLTQEPGPYLAECRWFQDRRVAILASDTWGLEVVDPAVTQGLAFPCHQELLGRYGVRIGESFVTDGPIADHAYEGVVVITPENIPGATAGSSAPCFLGQPGLPPHD